METSLGPRFLPGNHVETLVNGDEIFPALLRAIKSARHTINFEPYYYADGLIARQFTAALAERARAGVRVNMILDAQGAWASGRHNRAALRRAGVQLRTYRSLFWLDPRRYNNRSHRRLLIVDGRVGFVGGVGIADQWMGDAKHPAHWRDNHYRITGPVVAQLQAAFMDNWLKVKGTRLEGAAYFPPLAPSGSQTAQAFISSPREGLLNTHLMYRLAIAGACGSLIIQNAYLLPDTVLRDEIIAAARRGVKVEILMPGRLTDYQLVRTASRRYWPELIEAGVKIYEYAPAMMHVKLLIVDATFVSVGSSNFDRRSFHLNDEANLNVIDRRFAAEQRRLFEADKLRAHEVTLTQARQVHPSAVPHALVTVLAPQL